MKHTLVNCVRELRSEVARVDSPFLIVMVGLPGSGKSTFVKQLTDGWNVPLVIASTDDLVERESSKIGKGYSFHEVNFKEINREFKRIITDAVRERRHVLVDQTSVHAKSRHSKLEMVTSSYVKVAVVCDVPEAVMWERLNQRASTTGKLIPGHVVKDMVKRWISPQLSEGFNLIYEVEMT